MFARKFFNMVIFILALIIQVDFSIAHHSGLDGYQFVSPLPGSSMNLPGSAIIIREGNLIDDTSLNSIAIIVEGSKSGVHSCGLKLSADKRTLILQSHEKFDLGEKVYINYWGGMKTINGEFLIPFQFDFNICERRVNYENEILYLKNLTLNEISNLNTKESKKAKESFLEYPPISVITSNNPSDGYIFVSPYDLSLTEGHYLIILDNSAVPIFFQQTQFEKFDFKLQSNGMLTYWDKNTAKFYAMDSSYTIVDTFACRNGYSTDLHDLQILPNGHSLLLSYDPQIVRMDTIIQGGDTAAVVIGLIIQELDEQKNLVFIWRSWDHFQITDATVDVDLTAHTIDYVHGNAIELDSDGNLLLSSKNLDEITKINRQTGEVIWRWGGLESKNNEFLFVGDPITFSHQHDIRKLANGNLTLYDNGVLHIPKNSRSLEYQLDEENKIATLVWKFNYDPIKYYSSMGNSQRLLNNNTMIGWGWSTVNPIKVTEVCVDGTVSLELEFPDSYVTYRAFRFSWRTNLFITDPESIFFESIPVGDSATTTINLISNSSQELNITGFFNRNNSYIIEHNVPFVLPPYSSKLIDIKFKPVEEGYYTDTLHIRSDTDTSRIAQLMVLAGRTDTTFSSVANENIPGTFKLEQNYPNPFNPRTIVKYQIPDLPAGRQGLSFVTIKVYDVLGTEFAVLVNEEKPAGSYEVEFNGTELTSGIYFYQLRAGNFVETKKMVLLK